VAIAIARTLTENRDSGGYGTWRVYLVLLAALLTLRPAILSATEYVGNVVGITDGDTDLRRHIGRPDWTARMRSHIVDEIADLAALNAGLFESRGGGVHDPFRVCAAAQARHEPGRFSALLA
jgi:hypothetical protein